MQHSALHAHGYAIWQDRESSHNVEADSLQCCHCGLQFWVTPGSGKRRGFCTNCGQVTCGQEKCDPCIPWQKKIELIEAGLADHSLISTGRAEGLPESVGMTITRPGPNTLILPGGCHDLSPCQ